MNNDTAKEIREILMAYIMAIKDGDYDDPVEMVDDIKRDLDRIIISGIGAT